MKFVPILFSSVILCACQSADSSDTSLSSRPASTIDVSEYPDFTAKADRNKVEDYWVKTVSKNPQYPMHSALAGVSGCVEIVYSINASGKPEGYRIVNAFPANTFEDNALAALARWRWEPSPTNSDKQPVLTSTQLDFVVSNSKNVDLAREKCGIEPIS
ncbi:energy transducer TonB [Alteromonas antoniana]|uniref:energy transducer TonB n=1 Tax=Alteromonas antoniana TaxID=2803813 RepID=UPI001C45C116|nr:energy transducer TonB [Alteromonas antoniana]